MPTFRMRPGSSWPVSASAARSSSTTGRGTFASTAVPHRPSPRSSRRSVRAGRNRSRRRTARSRRRPNDRMTDWLRRAGRGRRGDDWVIWSVSEGSRGRRWREVVYSGDRVFAALLLETHPTGTFAHLELATASGLLTLHPEGDDTLHGNVVASTGIEHV